MIWFDWVLLLLLSAGMLLSARSDLKKAIVPNQVVLPAIALTFFGSIAEYLVVNPAELKLYLLNVSVLTVASVLLYALHIWGGGDSKLLILVGSGVPVHCYYRGAGQALPLATVLVLIFSFGYAFLIADSLIKWCRRREKTSKRVSRNDIIAFLKEYLIVSGYMVCLNAAMEKWNPEFAAQNAPLVLLIRMFAVMIVCTVKFFRRSAVWKTVLLCAVGISIYTRTIPFSTSVTAYFGFAAFILLHKLMDQFNYELLPAEKLQKGMILSAYSYFELQKYGMKWERMLLTEDLRSRLSAEEIKQIQAMKKKPPNLTIVAKIPFAIFILLGTCSYLVLGVLAG